jgi:hypothetical protein
MSQDNTDTIYQNDGHPAQQEYVRVQVADVQCLQTYLIQSIKEQSSVWEGAALQALSCCFSIRCARFAKGELVDASAAGSEAMASAYRGLKKATPPGRSQRTQAEPRSREICDPAGHSELPVQVCTDVNQGLQRRGAPTGYGGEGTRFSYRSQYATVLNLRLRWQMSRTVRQVL